MNNLKMNVFLASLAYLPIIYIVKSRANVSWSVFCASNSQRYKYHNNAFEHNILKQPKLLIFHLFTIIRVDRNIVKKSHWPNFATKIYIYIYIQGVLEFFEQNLTDCSFELYKHIELHKGMSESV